MNSTIRLRPQVVDDVVEAFKWYQERGEGLGHEFLRAYLAALSALGKSASLHRAWYKDYRRILLRRFPYAIHFQVSGKNVIVVLVSHCTRSPRQSKPTSRGRAPA